MKVHMADHYCILGDFNSITNRGERIGEVVGVERVEDTRMFNVFMDNSGLIDLPLMGRKFTWAQ
ncbi:endonuclease/exonuclease/phosphatase family protein, partial [Trifolium medium]|nr:endonuclease/exonuclease/phosphatase family protein [Trifolium medium]